MKQFENNRKNNRQKKTENYRKTIGNNLLLIHVSQVRQCITHYMSESCLNRFKG